MPILHAVAESQHTAFRIGQGTLLLPYGVVRSSLVQSDLLMLHFAKSVGDPLKEGGIAAESYAVVFTSIYIVAEGIGSGATG